MSYQDFANTTKFLTPGTVSIEAIRKAQKADPFALNLLKNKSNRFIKIDDVLFHTSPNRNENRLVLPNNLLDALIVSKHITVFGLGKGLSPPIIRDQKRQQRTRKSPGARKIKHIVLGW